MAIAMWLRVLLCHPVTQDSRQALRNCLLAPMFHRAKGRVCVWYSQLHGWIKFLHATWKCFFSSGWQIIFWNFYMNLDPRTWFRRERGSTLVLMLTRFPQHLFWPTIKKQILSTHEDFFSQITSQVAVGTMSLFPGFSTQNDFKFVVGWWNATFLLCS